MADIFFSFIHKKPHIDYVKLFIYTPTYARNGFRVPSGGHTSTLVTRFNGYFSRLFLLFNFHLSIPINADADRLANNFFSFNHIISFVFLIRAIRISKPYHQSGSTFIPAAVEG